jgi:hypothetical protein
MRFTIRDVLWLSLVLGMGVGWWVHLTAVHDRFAKELSRCEMEVAKAKDERNALLLDPFARRWPPVAPSDQNR